jgi:hypothetical protein
MWVKPKLLQIACNSFDDLLIPTLGVLGCCSIHLVDIINLKYLYKLIIKIVKSPTKGAEKFKYLVAAADHLITPRVKARRACSRV